MKEYSWETYIVQKGNKVLDQVATEVPLADISSEKIQNLLNDMFIRLAEQDDGVALAAPQIGAPLQIFVISEKAFKKMHLLEHLVYINPVITKKSKKTRTMSEGCLSVRGIYGKTVRHERATVTAYDEHGKLFTRTGSGLLAQIFQHEIDHLHGILFDSHAFDIKSV